MGPMCLIILKGPCHKVSCLFIENRNKTSTISLGRNFLSFVPRSYWAFCHSCDILRFWHAICCALLIRSCSSCRYLSAVIPGPTSLSHSSLMICNKPLGLCPSMKWKSKNWVDSWGALCSVNKEASTLSHLHGSSCVHLWSTLLMVPLSLFTNPLVCGWYMVFLGS